MFDEIAENAPEIKADARYWFVRTEGGDLYEAFVQTKTIAIGHGMISLEFIRSLGENAKESLKKEIKKHYPPQMNAERRITDLSGLAASQILRFCTEMKKGDVVVIPSEKTERLAIGFLVEDKAFEEPLHYKETKFAHHRLRRKVEWVTGASRSKLNPNLFKLFLNQQAVVDATPYASWIDAQLYQFFRKGDDYHYVMRVGTPDHIPAQSLFRVCLELFDLANDFAKSEGVEEHFEEIETRINLNSPGDVELWKAGAVAISALAVLVVFINGGGFEWKSAGISLKTDGLISRLNQFLNDRENRKRAESIRKKLDGLQIESPEQVIDLLNAENSKKLPPAAKKQTKTAKTKKPEK